MSQHYRYCSEKKTFDDKLTNDTELAQVELDIPIVANKLNKNYKKK